MSRVTAGRAGERLDRDVEAGATHQGWSIPGRAAKASFARQDAAFRGNCMAKVLLGLLLLLAVPALQARDWDDEVIKAAQHNFPEFLDLLAIPDVADNPADIRR